MRRLLATALLSGMLAGLVFFCAQSVTTRPLIVQAEILEHAATHAPGAAPHSHDWAPAEGFERAAFTVAADALIGIGFAFLLVGAISLSGRTVTPATGLAWGAAGYLVFCVAPSLGLPAEPPGVEAAGLLARQAWWLATAGATAGGLGMLAFARRPAWRAGGAVLLVLPHLVGAPRLDGAEPNPLEVQFMLASLAANAALWATLGLAVGWLWDRLGQPEPLRA